MTTTKTSAKKAAKRSRDVTRTVRSMAHLERLEEAKGKRVVADLDAPAVEALEVLLGAGYGSSQVSVIRRALVEAASKKFKKSA